MTHKEECSCKVVWGFHYGVTIEYCPLHKAAPDLYEALKYIIRELDKASIIKADSIFMVMPNKALAKVEEECP